ncbi:MAG: DEAD/DEAH box helicase family protein [Methanomicrobiales archaeon]|nr:DEAD/DEAH box helicase family protein [Methanomicrobiales archaeon]
MTPEEKARKKIDALLELAGWKVQDIRDYDPHASLGVAIREFPLSCGEADYALFVDRIGVGVIEAKPEGTTLGGVDSQSGKYAESFPENYPHVHLPLPFVYESTGTETLFRDLRDPTPRSRNVFSFHRPETLHEWIHQQDTLRARLRQMPPLLSTNLRECQNEAITNLERSFADAHPRALVQMATGSGKTFTAVSFIYRLIRYGGAKRVLFLVDRNNLGRQTKREFEQYITPDDGRKFTEIYNVQHLTTNKIDPVNKVTITTIQRLFSMLKGEAEYDEANEEESLYDHGPADAQPRTVTYNPAIPIETFDFIVTDECHRSIYHLWRQVLEYFDGFLIGLTATPSKQTLGFFRNNLVMEYLHERAVADGVNVGYDVFRIRTAITENGSVVERGFYVDTRDKNTREQRWEQLDDDFQYSAGQLDRSVVAPDQIRTVLKAFRDSLPIIFPNRTWVPKTLIFAKDDSHAEDITHICREVFAEGNDFCKKITYRTTGEKPEDLIQSFRNSPRLRIAVSVDMVSTGTDIRPLECLLFMRDVKSKVYFEQMMGRGTRVISPTELQSVTPDVAAKTHFVVVDAVGVCESVKIESCPLERKRGISFEKLVQSIAFGVRDTDSITSLAGRLSRLDRELVEPDRKAIMNAAGGTSLRRMINDLFDAVDPDRQIEKAKAMFDTQAPTPEQVKTAGQDLAKAACAPLEVPQIRNTLLAIHKKNEQVIDTVSADTVLEAGWDAQAALKSRTVVDTFRKFIEENKDELAALQIIYSRPYGHRHFTYEQIRQLADAIHKPPYNLTTEQVWRAYEQLEKTKVRGAGPQKLLTDIIALIRFAIAETPVLEPFTSSVSRAFDLWLDNQQKQGRQFTAEQIRWLEMIRDHIAGSAEIAMEDFDAIPFNQWGGRIKAYSLFGNELPMILNQLNEALT